MKSQLSKENLLQKIKKRFDHSAKPGQSTDARSLSVFIEKKIALLGKIAIFD